MHSSFNSVTFKAECALGVFFSILSGLFVLFLCLVWFFFYNVLKKVHLRFVSCCSELSLYHFLSDISTFVLEIKMSRKKAKEESDRFKAWLG